ncbi:MAG: hypothetical protein ABR976_15910 [Terracidiphilus sp.]
MFLSLLRLTALLTPGNEFLRECWCNRDLCETRLGLAPGAYFPLVRGLSDLDLAEFRIEATPPQAKQLAWSKSIGHVESEQNPVPQRQTGQRGPQLIPTQNRLVRVAQRRRCLYGARWVFEKEVLFDRLPKDGPHVGSSVQHSVLRPGFGQPIEVGLESELIDVFEPYTPESIDEIGLDEILFRLGRFFFPVRFFQRQVAVLDKPIEGDAAVSYNPIFCNLSGEPLDFEFQLFARLKLGHLGFQSERNRI